jgi:acetoin utilization deacetylase AcuC-like enzyme
MHTFYHPGHERHDPAQMHRPETPNRNTYYGEVAKRGRLIHEAILTADLGPIATPADFGIEPIGDIHEYGMLALLQTAYERMASEHGGRLALPNAFRVSARAQRRKPRSIWGLLGYYAFDIGSPIFKDTWDVAYWSAQTAVSAAALVAAAGSDSEMAYALCRPPGHHAAADYFGGFCYLNNVAIAANWLVEQGQRVAILDLDYHHGNGTQAIFYNRSETLFCSIHADPLNEYPYYWGYADEYGVGPGENYNFNYPLPRGTRETEYLSALDDALDRIRRFVPDTLLVSLGVDMVKDDPIGGFNLNGDSIRRMGRRIGDLRIPLVVVQEGGYHLPSLGENVLRFLMALKNRGETPSAT